MTDKPEAWIVDTGHTGWSHEEQMHLWARAITIGVRSLKAGVAHSDHPDADWFQMSDRMAATYGYNLMHHYNAWKREQAAQELVTEMRSYDAYLGGVRA